MVDAVITVAAPERILVSKEALRKVLVALNGPGYFIAELQATRDLEKLTGDPNPIDVLIKDFKKGETQ